MELVREIKVAVVVAGSGGVLQVVWGKKARKRAEKLAARANLRQATHRAGVVEGVLVIPRDEPAPVPAAKPSKAAGATVEGEYKPDYKHGCENCGQVPVVTVVDPAGQVVLETGLCGPCAWGEAETIDPATW